MGKVRRSRVLSTEDFSEILVLFHNEVCFEELEGKLNIAITPRIREHLATAFRTYAFTECSHLERTEVTAARAKLRKLIRRFLDDVSGMRHAANPAFRQACDEFGFGAPPLDGATKAERLLDDCLEFDEIRNPLKRQQPPKRREQIFCTLFIAFRAAGGKPTANWTGKNKAIQGRFVEFCRMLVQNCPEPVRSDLGLGLASALRTQLRLWRRAPQARGAPDHTLGQATLRYLTASSQVVIARRVEVVTTLVTAPERLGGRMIRPKARARKLNRAENQH